MWADPGRRSDSPASRGLHRKSSSGSGEAFHPVAIRRLHVRLEPFRAASTRCSRLASTPDFFARPGPDRVACIRLHVRPCPHLPPYVRPLRRALCEERSRLVHDDAERARGLPPVDGTRLRIRRPRPCAAAEARKSPSYLARELALKRRREAREETGLEVHVRTAVKIVDRFPFCWAGVNLRRHHALLPGDVCARPSLRRRLARASRSRGVARHPDVARDGAERGLAAHSRRLRTPQRLTAAP